MAGYLHSKSKAATICGTTPTEHYSENVGKFWRIPRQKRCFTLGDKIETSLLEVLDLLSAPQSTNTKTAN